LINEIDYFLNNKKTFKLFNLKNKEIGVENFKNQKFIKKDLIFLINNFINYKKQSINKNLNNDDFYKKNILNFTQYTKYGENYLNEN
jgi:hypothetical protein